MSRSRVPFWHPMAFGSLRHWRRLLRESGGIDPQCRFWAARTALFSSLWFPFRAGEKMLYERRVQSTPIQHPPIFILGHWRTGTTLLHNLFCQDPSLGYVSTFQTLVPESFLVGQKTFFPLISSRIPKTRPMDSMPLGARLPQEEEVALSNLSPHSFYVSWYFPRRMRELFQKYALFEGLSASAVDEWKSVYLHLLRKATYHAKGRRLVLKNPVNTGRVGALLDLFPDAKFIHICRNPYDILDSTHRLFRTATDLVGLQSIDDSEIRDNVLSFYSQMMRRFVDERAKIHPDNFAEVRFEELERQPLAEMEKLYRALDLPGWETACPRMERHIAGLTGYKKNRYRLKPEDATAIEEHWAFAFDTWGYPMTRLGQPEA